MADTTNIEDLPSEPQNNVVLETKMPNDYEKVLNETPNNNNVPSAAENQKMMNELVSGIQQASANGATTLPSRDIPMNESQITQDPNIKANYVEEHPNNDYIEESQNVEDYILHNSKQTTRNDSIEEILETIQIPLLLGILYFIFQLPFIKNLVFNYFPSLFSSDGNQNLGGYLFFSILYAISYFSITNILQRLEM